MGEHITLADITANDLRQIFAEMQIVVTGPELAITYDPETGEEIRIAQTVAEVQIGGEIFGRSVASSPQLLEADARPEIVANLRKMVQVSLRAKIAENLGVMLTREQMEAL